MDRVMKLRNSGKRKHKLLSPAAAASLRMAGLAAEQQRGMESLMKLRDLNHKLLQNPGAAYEEQDSYDMAAIFNNNRWIEWTMRMRRYNDMQEKQILEDRLDVVLDHPLDHPILRGKRLRKTPNRKWNPTPPPGILKQLMWETQRSVRNGKLVSERRERWTKDLLERKRLAAAGGEIAQQQQPSAASPSLEGEGEAAAAAAASLPLNGEITAQPSAASPSLEGEGEEAAAAAAASLPLSGEITAQPH